MDEARTPFTALVQRARRILWGQRLRRSLWCSLWVSALSMLLLGAIHTGLAGVSPQLWMSLALVPPLLSVVYTLLWQRPTGEFVAAELDRRGDYDNLLITAWEALALSRSQRSAAAIVVLQEAENLSPQIRIPDGPAINSNWQTRFRVAPWGLIAIAVFLLQLPTQPDRDMAQYMDAAAHFGNGSGNVGDVRFGSTMSLDQQQADQSEAASVSGKYAPQLAFSEQPPTDGSANSKDGKLDVIASSPDEQRSPGNKRIHATGERSMTQSENAGASRPDRQESAAGGEENSLLSLQFEPVARQAAGAAEQTISGSSSITLSTTTIARANAGSATAGGVAIKPGSAPYDNRFSLSQRLYIKSYYRSLETMP